MGEIIGPELPASAVNFLRGGKIVVVTTVDREGRPNAAPFSWVVAKDNKTIRLGINQGVATLENIRHRGEVCLSLTGPELHLTVKGTARVVKDTIEDAPIPTAVVEVEVREVKDDAIIGRTRPGEERTRWTQRRRLLSDSTIISALLQA